MIRPARRSWSSLRTAVLAAACLPLLASLPSNASSQAVVQKKGRASPPASEPARRPGEDPAILLDRANYFVAQGRFPEAISVLEVLVARNSQVAIANSMLAECYMKTGRSQDAAALLERCLEGDAGNKTYLQDLGNAYVDLGRRDQAVETWRRILAGEDKFGSMHALVAKLEQEAGFYDEAIADLRDGMRFKENADYYAHEVVRLERAIGRDEEAFRDGLVLLGGRPGLIEGDIQSVSQIYRESKKQERLVAIVDSIIASRGDRNGLYRTLETILLVDGGKYDDARRRLFGKGAPAPRDDQLYSIIVHMGRVTERRGDERFAALERDLMRRFLESFDASTYAPGVMLMMAASKRSEGKEAAAPAREKLFDEALALADGVKHHRLGGPYFENVYLFRAQVLFEDLHRPDDALAELAAIPPRGGGGQTSAAQELRVRILLASGDRGAAAAALKRIAADPDTTVAYLGRYGLGRLAFLAGKYDESVKILSDLAEKHPSSAWANDALELAMDEKGAMPEGSGPLGLYRSAVFDRSRGELPAAADSLAEIGKRFPASYLAPRALFMKGEIEIDSAAPAAPAAGSPGAGGRGPGGPAAGGLAAARADFTKLAESYPLHDLAPRSLERLAELEARENPGEAVAQYARLMELYPDYPFMERVRERYIELGKTVGAEAPKKGSK